MTYNVLNGTLNSTIHTLLRGTLYSSVRTVQKSFTSVKIHPYPKWQRLRAGDTLRRVSPAGNHCHFLLDKDERCPAADLSNIGCTNGPAYSTSELLNTPQKALP